MTDRTTSFLVILDKEYRTDDAEIILKAIEMIKGVLKVEINISDRFEYMSAKKHFREELRKKLYEVIMSL